MHDPPRRRANQRAGRGSYANDCPPIFVVKGRWSGAVRYEVCHRSDAVTCPAVVRRAAKPGARWLHTDDWQGYARVERALTLPHATVRHGQVGEWREWARDDDGDGVREVHSNGCEGAGAWLRTCLRVFRGVHNRYLGDYVATFVAMTNSQQITPQIIQRMCFIRTEPQLKNT